MNNVVEFVKPKGFILDTNVVSEIMKPTPDSIVRVWLNTQVYSTLYLSSITLAELLFGVAILPDGRRKEILAKALSSSLKLFEQRVLAFDTKAAQKYADIGAIARAKGLGLPTPDSYIAAIAKANDLGVATRDVAPFQAVGLKVVNPWG
jgi:toxin FitB